MRSFLLIAASIVTLVVIFTVYLSIQESPSPVVDQQISAVSAPVVLPAATGPSRIGPGENVWYDRYDPKTGELSSRIRAASYEWQKDRRVAVSGPEAEFYLSDGQVLKLVGTTGTLVMQEGIGRGSDVPGVENIGQSPRMGELKEVTLSLLPAAGAEPVLTMTMNNASFDNETFKIYTDAYREDGKLITGDQVPVTVRGVDYEFDGRGLQVQYSELERRLEYLRIAHGKRLLIKNPSGFLRSGASQKLLGQANPFAGVMLAAADPQLAGEAAGSLRKSTSRRSTAPTVYHAVFHDNIEIVQGGAPMARGEQLQVDFQEEDRSSGETHAPRTRPADEKVTKPASRPARESRGTAGRRADSEFGGNDSTQPQNEPVEIRWSGPLVVTPLAGERSTRIGPGETVIKLVGSAARPVQLTRHNNGIDSQVTCATLTHWSIDNGALLESGAGVPVQLTDSRGTRIVTRRMSFSQADGSAQLRGRSSARLPLTGLRPDEKPSAAELMDVSWADDCTLRFDGGFDEMILRQAVLSGDVAVAHPDLKMNCRSMDLQFDSDTPAAQPGHEEGLASSDLRQIDAKGDVKCVFNGPGGENDVRRFDCQNLTLVGAHDPAGKWYARTIDAIGEVHASDAQRDLRAGNVSMVLDPPAAKEPHASVPATRPAKQDAMPGQLRSMVAHDNVRVSGTDGQSAAADLLVIESKNDQTQITLHGSPAVVRQKDGMLSGKVINLSPETEQLAIDGEGRMEGMMRPADGGEARPVELTWTRMLDLRDGVVECSGDVTANSTDSDGSVQVAKGARAVLKTVPKPATQPSQGSTPQTRPAGELNIMADRMVESLVLDGGAKLSSTLADAQGQPLRLFVLESQQVKVQQNAPKQQRLTIPGAGRMLFVDNTQPTTRPAGGEDSMSLRGKTAFSWEQGLTYDQASQQIVMSGKVLVGRVEEEGEQVEPMQLRADRIIAEVEPDEAAKTGPVAGALSSQAKLKHVRAEGNLTIVSRNLNIEAATIDYDPDAHLLIARGAGRQRVRQLDGKGLEVASFDEFVWDTQKSMLRSSKGGRITGRK